MIADKKRIKNGGNKKHGKFQPNLGGVGGLPPLKEIPNDVAAHHVFEITLKISKSGENYQLGPLQRRRVGPDPKSGQQQKFAIRFKKKLK